MKESIDKNDEHGGGSVVQSGNNDNEERQTWSKQIEFLLSCIGYSVGLGNVWRFGYLATKSGGGAFLIPYFVTLFLIAIPLMYMEFIVGQFTRRGPIGALSKLCPFFKGAGIATVVISFWLTTYYIVIIGWDVYFIFSSFAKEVPWKRCDKEWNTDRCWDGYLNDSYKISNDTRSPSEEFYRFKILNEAERMEDFGLPKWDLTLIVLLVWIVIYFALFKGVRSSGKVVYVTAIFPYFIIVIMLIRGVTLEGSLDGIMYFITPKWKDVLKPSVWANAAIQNFNSVGVAFGGLISMASYKKKESKIMRDVIAISIVDCITSVMCGCTVFSVLGYIAHIQSKSIDDVIVSGPGLVFMVLPEAIRNMPLAPLWSILFFLMIFMLGIDSQFTMVDTVITTIEDEFGIKLKRFYRKREILVLIVCIITFFLSLPTLCPGGIYYFTILDYFSAGISVFYIAFFEVLAIVWIYGANRLCRNIQNLTGEKPSVIFVFCWKYVAPLIILVIWAINWYSYEPVTYGNYQFPLGAHIFGWSVALISIIAIPIGSIHAVITSPRETLLEKIKYSFKPTIDDIEKKAFQLKASKKVDIIEDVLKV